MCVDRNDRGDVIVGWLTKITAVIVLVAIPSFDAIAVGVARVGASDTAQNAAIAGADTWRLNRDVQKAYESAVAYAVDHGATIAPADFAVATDGTVTVTVHREVTTLVFHRIGATRKWTHAVATASGKSV
ncbi:MAG: hypothetical protein QOE45_3227 [Frankiaceae bacterium]|jgi:hypothetical protein|nr:hypothetical protein [Frankiaceae bacterium]